MDKLEERKLQYKKLIDLRVDTVRRLDMVKEQTKKLVDTRRSIERIRSVQLKNQQQKMKEAIKERNFELIAKHSKNVAQIEKELKVMKKLFKVTNKVNYIADKNSDIAKRINMKMEAMALREARARNIITKQIAKIGNGISAVSLKGLQLKSDFQQWRLSKNAEKYDKKFDKFIQYKKDDLNKHLNTFKNSNEKFSLSSNEMKKEVVNKEPLKNYTVTKKDDTTLYTHTETKTVVKEQGNTITAISGKSNEDKAKALIDIAKSKGWDLSKVSVNGSPEFKAVMEKQIKEELEKSKPKDNSFQKLQQMEKQKKDNVNSLAVEQKENKISQQQR